jgi:dTDP-4-amino-4,6-dideoxygalactose transaminase
MFAHDASHAPVCERLFRDGVCLPSGSSMSDADVGRVIAACERVLGAPKSAARDTAPAARTV